MPRGRTKFRILSDILHALPGPPAQIREQAGISSGSAWKKLVDHLYDRGIIAQIEVTNADRRSSYEIMLTQAGQNLLEEMDKVDRYLEEYT